MPAPNATPSRPRRRTVVTLTVAVLLLAATACSGSEPAGRVAIVGDSTTDVAVPAITEAVNGTVDVRAVWGATVQNMQGQAAQLAQQPTDHLVINLGTNDALRGLDPVAAAEGIVTIINGFTVTSGCIHLVTVSEHMESRGGSDAPTVAAGINEQLRSLADAYGFRIVDWNAIVEEQLDAGIVPTEDTIHPTDEGARLMADAIATSIDAC